MTAIAAATPHVEPAPLNGAPQAASQSKASRTRADTVFSAIEQEIARKPNATERDEDDADKDGAMQAPSVKGDCTSHQSRPEQAADSSRNILATMTLFELKQASPEVNDAIAPDSVDGAAASPGRAIVGIDLGDGALAAANRLLKADDVTNNAAPSRSAAGSPAMFAVTPDDLLRKALTSDDGEQWPPALRDERTDSWSDTSFARSGPDTTSASQIRLSVQGFETHFPLAISQFIPNVSTSSAPMEHVDVDIRLQPMAGAEQTAAPARVLTIQLEPDSLGTIAVRMKLIHNRVDLQIRVDNIDALSLLTGARDDLVRAISAGGHSVEGISVKISPTLASSVNHQSDASAGDFTNSMSGRQYDGRKRGGGEQMDNGAGSRSLAGSLARLAGGNENESPRADNASHLSSVYL